MGYSHYTGRPAILQKKKFSLASSDCQRVVSHIQQTTGLALCRQERVDEKLDKFVPSGEPWFGAESVEFNGIDQDAHEDFAIPRVTAPEEWQSQRKKDFISDFCKTARKPYDFAVCCCLIVFKHHFGKKFDVSSDGDDDEENWPAARKVCQEVLGHGEDFTLYNPVPLTMGGLGIEKETEGEKRKREESFLGPRKRTRFGLDNGWVIYRGRKDPHNYHSRRVCQIMPDGYNYDKVRMIGEANSVPAAQWLATCRFLAREFEGAPGADKFPVAAEAEGWTPILVWLDFLEEESPKTAERLRKWMPLKLRRSKVVA